MNTRKIRLGNTTIGGNSKILIQSMCNTLTKDINATIMQINKLANEGCEIIRVSVPDMESAKALKRIKNEINIPLAADIHFDYRLAIEASKYADKLRINPGNIGNTEKIKKVINEAVKYSIPIRIGVNLGSLEKEIEEKYGLTAEAMVKSAERHIKILEENNFKNIIVSLKSSDVNKVIDANRLFSKKYDYPLHLGITEAGTLFTGAINNAIGLGILLKEGIGDTIRVSLACDPAEEVKAGWQILKALDIRNRGIKVIACPTCARANIDVPKIAEKIEEKTSHIKTPLKIAVMGCIVNGIGESKKTDIGIIGTKKNAILYKEGKKKTLIEKDNIINTILREIKI